MDRKTTTAGHRFFLPVPGEINQEKATADEQESKFQHLSFCMNVCRGFLRIYIVVTVDGCGIPPGDTI